MFGITYKCTSFLTIVHTSAGKLHVLGLLLTDYVTLLCEGERQRHEHQQLQSSLANLAGARNGYCRHNKVVFSHRGKNVISRTELALAVRYRSQFHCIHMIVMFLIQ